MIDLLKINKKIVAIVGLLLAVVVGGVLLSGARGDLSGNKVAGGLAEYNAETLLKYKNAYAGDNSKVVSIVDSLPYAGSRREVSLQTASAPCGITVNYDFNGHTADLQRVNWALHNNAVVMFALIDNADIINFYCSGLSGQSKCRFTRNEEQGNYQTDLRKYPGDRGSFDAFLRGLAFRISVFPKKYTPSMSSVPGIRISAEYLGAVAKVRYEADRGSLLTWDITGGGVSKGEAAIELPYDIPVYWSPFHINGQGLVDRGSLMNVVLLDDTGNIIDKKSLTIVYDGSLFYSVSPSPGIVWGSGSQLSDRKPQDLDEAVGRAVKGRGASYSEGEAAAEGHVILAAEDKNGTVRAYTIASFGYFGFENGIFTKISGSGAIPTVMTFSKNEKGEYSLLEYKEPVDGAGYADSIKKMFPGDLWDKVISMDKYPDLVKQQEDQAGAYLTGIGRKAEVSAGNVEKKLANIDVQASNKLFSELTKYNSFLNNCPYWLGTRERIENGSRYIYETSQGKTGDGYDLITFRKKTEDGAPVEEYSYVIMGSEPQLLSHKGTIEVK